MTCTPSFGVRPCSSVTKKMTARRRGRRGGAWSGGWGGTGGRKGRRTSERDAARDPAFGRVSCGDEDAICGRAVEERGGCMRPTRHSLLRKDLDKQVWSALRPRIRLGEGGRRTMQPDAVKPRRIAFAAKMTVTRYLGLR